MRSNQTFGIHFLLRANKIKDGKAPLYVKITINGRHAELSLKQTVNLTDWNSLRGMAKPKDQPLKELNSYLEKVRSQLVVHYQDMQLQKKLITPATIKSAFIGEDEEQHGLCELLDYHKYPDARYP
jgi:hypothetical protein